MNDQQLMIAKKLLTPFSAHGRAYVWISCLTTLIGWDLASRSLSTTVIDKLPSYVFAGFAVSLHIQIFRGMSIKFWMISSMQTLFVFFWEIVYNTFMIFQYEVFIVWYLYRHRLNTLYGITSMCQLRMQCFPEPVKDVLNRYDRAIFKDISVWEAIVVSALISRGTKQIEPSCYFYVTLKSSCQIKGCFG